MNPAAWSARSRCTAFWIFGVHGKLRSAFPFGTFYSTQKWLDECFDGEKGIGKVTELAKNLANLVDDSVSQSTWKGMGEEYSDKEIGKMSLTKDLASLVQESCDVHKRKLKPRKRLEAKRFLELRIKKKVKEQFRNGKFQDLLTNVIADPNTLKDAYDCLRIASNVDLASNCDTLSFQSIADELAYGNFDVGANTYSISTRGAKVKKEKLVLPKLKLRIVQEAIRIVLDVVYRPHLSKICHGFRSGRSHSSALKYICKEIPDPDWWFTIPIKKELDGCILSKLLSLIEEKIEDPNLCGMIRDMFDVRVLNVEFGSFAKGHGLPQEGVLSPVLINIYLDLFDREVYRMSMQYEIADSYHSEEKGSHSKLRGWFRRQINGGDVEQNNIWKNSGIRVHCCRFMDEILFAVIGPKEVALAFKFDIETYLKDSLYLEVEYKTDILASTDCHGVRFLGICIRRQLKKNDDVRAIHKLRDKVKIFAEQRQEAWDAGAVRIGKKWLAHGLKSVKESEIKLLVDPMSILHQISVYRKTGMKTDHWYKVLLKIWMQDMYSKRAGNEEIILAKHIVEPALPKELVDSYYAFQRRAKEYVALETASMVALSSGHDSAPNAVYITEILAPVNSIMKRLFRYGLTNIEGYARTCYILVLLDDDQIIDWFAGIARRWLRWYSDCNNFDQVKQIISNQVRMSCIRTFASKYRIHEAEIAKKLDTELSRIPSVEDFELEKAHKDLISQENTFDGVLTYGINYSGACFLALAKIATQFQPCNVIGCTVPVSSVYMLHVMERQKFPAWKTGFSSCIHPSLHRRKIRLCKQHLKDVFLGDISLQSVDFCDQT